MSFYSDKIVAKNPPANTIDEKKIHLLPIIVASWAAESTDFWTSAAETDTLTFCPEFFVF
jgi:hypothetical protein